MDRLHSIGRAVLDAFHSNKRVVSFAEYMALVRQSPQRHLRDAAHFTRDMFDHFGSELVPHPTGEIRRFKLFDAPWDDGDTRLVGEEAVQNAIYRIISNFARQGRVDRFILLHGANGSSKSTITELLASALEHYSALEEGALYSFNWVFPSQTVSKGGIGFAGRKEEMDPNETFAYLEDESIDARLICELHDHPLLLIPRRQREEILRQLLEGQGGADLEQLGDYLLRGELCHKCKLVFESLLNAYQGDLLRLLRHVQVERLFISRRYRKGTARVEPQLAVDAKMRQVTMDRSLSALPTALQSINLFELDGDLVQGNRGLVDFPDLFKRPIDAFKYLLTTVESGRVKLEQTNLFFDMLFVGSSNDAYLNAFMESPDWMSFKGRMELVRVPYLLDYTRERRIYDEQVLESDVGRHIAPHTTSAAALWAVLTRLTRPDPERFEAPLDDLVKDLTPMEKARLYGERKVPGRIKGDAARALRGGIAALWRETSNQVVYEGRVGASPREVKTAIFNAAQSSSYSCLSPLALLEELRQLVQETSVYPWLRQEVQGGYHDHKAFVDQVRTWYLEQADEDVRTAMGLVEEASYRELFSRYIVHVTHFVRKEKLRNPVTGALEEADPALMAEVESVLDVPDDREEYRNGIMTKIGAWSVDHSGERPDYAEIFPEHFERMSNNYYAQQRKRITRILEAAQRLLAEEEGGIDAGPLKQAKEMLRRMVDENGYCNHCAREAVSLLLRERYAD